MVLTSAARTRTVLILLFGVVLALTMTLASSASAAPPDRTDTRSDPARHVGDAPLIGETEAVPATVSGDLLDGGVTIASSGYSVTCTGEVEYPHYSSGAGGAISKIRITCTGSGLASVRVRAQGLLQFAKSSSSTNTNVTFVNRGDSDQWQWVTVNGATKTFYLPETGKNGGRGTGFWRATGTWYFEHPGGLSTVGSKTVTIFRTI